MEKGFLILLFVLSAKAEFDLQYIGDSLNDVAAQERDFCTTKYCVSDSQILFYSATQNSSVDPCVDFKEFSMGTFIKYRALHERYFAIGLLQDTQNFHKERQRKLLAKTFDAKNDGRVFKVLKNFFAKCVSSRNVRRNGKNEIVDYLKSLGGSPLLNGDSWDPTKFNLSKVLETEPYYGVLNLLDYEFTLKYAPDGWNKSHSIPSIVKEGIFSWESEDRIRFTQYKQMLSEMFELETVSISKREKLEMEIDKAVERLKSFSEEIAKHKAVKGSEVIQVKDLKSYTPNLSINWVQMLNDQLLKTAEMTEDDDILIYSPSTLKSFALALETIDKGIIADAFVLKFLYANRFLFIVYPFDWRDESYSNNLRAEQRWEQCLKYVEEHMRPGLEMLLSTAQERDPQKVDEFVRGVVNDFIDAIKAVDDESILSKEVQEKTLEKLSKIELLSHSFAKNFTKEHLEVFYDELNLQGEENLVESALEIRKFSNRIRNDYKDVFTKNSKSSIDSSSRNDLISYNTLSDELSVSAVWTFYPWFHPNRPKFFNQATLYLDILTNLRAQTVRYISNVLWFDVTKFMAATEEFKFAYDNYVEWETKGGKDLLLGANRMTTRQLFWLALARSRYRKQKASSGKQESDYDQTFFWFKHHEAPLETYESFREAFHCDSS